MPTTLVLAPKEIHDMAREILRAEWHHDIRLGQGNEDQDFIRLCIFLAHSDSSEPPVKLHGYPCAAKIAIIPYKQRVDKRADAEITIDALWWDNATEPAQRALLDHEISHLELSKDDLGCLKTDDQGRPKLSLRLHDWQLGGFRAIAQRYGDNAPEVAMARDFQKRHGDVALAAGNLFAMPVTARAGDGEEMFGGAR